GGIAPPLGGYMHPKDLDAWYRRTIEQIEQARGAELQLPAVLAPLCGRARGGHWELVTSRDPV
ncbi:MAG: hypothetical protein ACREEO_03270, partial [Phenylobacterium sp.]